MSPDRPAGAGLDTRRREAGRRALLAALALAALPCATGALAAASGRPARGVPLAGHIRAGFVETVIADSLDSPVSMAIAPDGRVFVCEQGGRLRVIRDGRLLARPFVTVPTVAEQEEGLLGVAFDPAFEANRRVYVTYTTLSPFRHDVIVRYVASGDTARAGSAQVIYEMDENVSHIHLGGALRFGRDGKLYAGTGENSDGKRSQSLRSTFGKILRLDPDGGIPRDNPFYTVASGRYRAIWARGLRNAFTLDISKSTGRMFINDVGGSAFEEVNDGIAGANYGWPIYEGPGERAGYRFPVHAYGHDRGCAITGGAFYEPSAPAFPREWVGRYFYAEYCANQIRWLDPAFPARDHVFGATLLPGPVDLRVGPDGGLYYLARGNSDATGGDHTSLGMVVRISRGGAASTPRGGRVPGRSK